MLQAKLKNTYTVFTTVLALIALSTPLPSQERIRRSQTPTGPPQGSEQLPVQAYRDFIRDLHGKANDIQSETADAIESLNLLNHAKQALNGISYLVVPNVTEDKIIQLKYEPLTALRSQIVLISEMYFHIKKCHSTGQIGQQSLRNTDTERYHLKRVSDLLQNMNVSLNNCLQQEIQNEPVDTIIYSSFFLRIPEIYRAYIILNDNLKLMAYLKETYETVFPALRRL